jgi:hypothetical protein
VLFFIGHDRRQNAHFNVTEHPPAVWVVQQLREALPFDTAPKHFIFDRDRIFSAEVVHAVKSIGMQPRPRSCRSTRLPTCAGPSPRGHACSARMANTSQSRAQPAGPRQPVIDRRHAPICPGVLSRPCRRMALGERPP